MEKLQNKIGWGFLIFAILIGIFIVFAKSSAPSDNNSANSNSNPSANKNIQIVKLSVNGGQYVLEPSTLKLGIPVKMEADIAQMPGCSKSVVISAFNVRKTVNSGDNIIEFTPNQAGTFNIACSMNMYRGTFTVQ